MRTKGALLILCLVLALGMSACGEGEPPQAHNGFVSGDYAYVPYQGQLFMINVRDPQAPRQVMRWADLSNESKVRDVVVDEELVYASISNYKEDVAGLQLIDASDPTMPVTRGYYQLPIHPSRAALLGDVLYVMSGNDLHVVDVSDPETPEKITGLTFDSNYYENDIYATDTHLYVNKSYHSFRWGSDSVAWIIDLTDPRAPFTETHELDDYIARDVAVAGGRVYGTDHQGTLCFRDEATPEADLICPEGLEGGYMVEANNSHVFTYKGGQIYIFEIGDAPPLKQVAILELKDCIRMELYGNYLYMLNDKGHFSIVDVSAPAQPAIASRLALDLAASKPAHIDPAPLALNCDRFGDPPSRLETAVHRPPHPEPPLPQPGMPRTHAHAVHTLFLDETSARLAAEAGFDTVVQVFPWRDINPEPGRYDWATADYMVRTAREHDLNLIVRLDLPPDWARTTIRGAGLPFDLAAYADFVSAVAQRYRGHILGYVIWNEPNLAAEWSRSGSARPDHWSTFDGWVADPADYVGVLGVAYRRIRRADPSARVVAAGLAPTNENSSRARDDRDVLDEMLALDAAACFDVLGIHAYGYGLDPAVDRESHERLNLGRILDLREIMEVHGVEKPLWITELGYTLASEHQPWVTEAQQADYLVSAMTRAEQEWPWVELFTVWNLTYGRPAGDEVGSYSLVAPDLTLRPAYIRLKEYLVGAGK